MRNLAWLTFLGLSLAFGPYACNQDIEGDVAGECTDGADNDRDGAFDCDDPDCAGAPACKSSTLDGGVGGSGGSGGGGSTKKWQHATCGGVHTCGVDVGGTVRCWGNAADGQSAAPAGAMDRVRASFFHSCARTSAGTLTCWGCKGSRDYGQCDVPAALTDVDRFDTGSYATCAVNGAGKATCWGCTGANQGQCAPPEGSYEDITAGSLHACGLVSGEARCWGNDEYGQSSPPSGTFTAIDAGTWHTCGVRADKSIACWGCQSPSPSEPADFGQCDAPAGAFDRVAVGVYHSCGLRTDGTIQCWGCVGSHDGVKTDEGQCTPPSGSFTDLDVGKYHGCAQRADGTLSCWGDNYFKQLEVP